MDFDAEDTLEAVLRAADNPVENIYKTADADSYDTGVTAPCVSIVCRQMQRTFPEARRGSTAFGNQTLFVTVKIRTQFDAEKQDNVTLKTARQSHADFRGRVFDVLYRDDLLDLLNQRGAEFGVAFNFADISPATRDAAGHGLETITQIELHAYGTGDKT